MRTHTLVCLITIKPITWSCSPLIFTSDPLNSHFCSSFMFIKASSSSASLFSFPFSLSLTLPGVHISLCTLIHWRYLRICFPLLSLLILSHYDSWHPVAFREQGYSQSFVSWVQDMSERARIMMKSSDVQEFQPLTLIIRGQFLTKNSNTMPL